MTRQHRLAGAFIAALLLGASGAIALAPSAAAAQITTDYPVVDVQAGQDATIALHLTPSGSTPERVALSVADAPPGWTATLQGGGFTIGAVYVGPDTSPGVTLHIAVPDDAKTGNYHVIVDANGADGARQLDMQFRVVAEASDAYALTADFAQLQGTTKDTYTFALKLANNTGSDATFGLTATGPDGWTVTAAPAAQNKASAVDVEAGASSDVSVTANPPANVEAGTYPIAVTAAGAGQELTEQLTVEVTGSPTVAMSTANQVLGASGSAGATTDVHLTLQNTGSAPLTGLSLASTPPSGWTVTFDPKTVDDIEPGASADVVAHIQPTGDAITGDYQVTLSANSSAATSSIDLRYTVETSSWWGLVGVVVIAAAIVVLLWLFRRYGRR